MKDNYLYQWETHIIHPLDYSTITVHTFIEETKIKKPLQKESYTKENTYATGPANRNHLLQISFFKENFPITIKHITSTCQKTQQYKKTRNYSIPM